jgi:hypothetical protein
MRWPGGLAQDGAVYDRASGRRNEEDQAGEAAAMMRRPGSLFEDQRLWQPALLGVLQGFAV